MRVLYIAQRLPYPPDRGDRIPTFNHICHLSGRHEVYVASLLESPDELAHVASLGRWAREVVTEMQPAWRRGLGMVSAWLTGEPLSVGHFRHPRLQARVTQLIRDKNIDAVVVFSSSMAPYVEGESQLKRVMNFCDLDSQKWQDLSEHAGWARRFVYRREARVLLAYERRIAQSFSANCVVTEEEAELFRRLVPGCAVTVLPNGVDSDFFGAKPRQPDACELVFVGVMDYAPNIEAVTFFVQQVWPGILAQRPDARFSIVGARPGREVKALGDVQGVRVTGLVDDVRDYLAKATLVVVPLQVARGIQNKILEAMAAGVPVLTTPQAAKGLAAGARDVLFVEPRDADAFRSAILQLLASPDVLHDRAEAARTFVRAHYDWQKTGDLLERLLSEDRAIGR